MLEPGESVIDVHRLPLELARAALLAGLVDALLAGCRRLTVVTGVGRCTSLRPPASRAANRWVSGSYPTNYEFVLKT